MTGGGALKSVLSLGAGVQSTVLMLMVLRGEFPDPPECAIFADTGWEPKEVYDHLGWLEGEAKKVGYPVYRVSAGNLREDALTPGRFASPPFHIKNKDGSNGILRRQCTWEYKIKPIRHKIKELIGGNVRKVQVDIWMGISLDEVQRMKDSDVKWLRNVYPLIDLRMTRHDCLQWLTKHGYAATPKSSCIGCPYHDNTSWRRMRDTLPDEWQDAVEFDYAMREVAKKEGLIEGEVYLHRSLVPLDQVDLSTEEDHGQFSLFGNECEGYCGL